MEISKCGCTNQFYINVTGSQSTSIQVLPITRNDFHTQGFNQKIKKIKLLGLKYSGSNHRQVWKVMVGLESTQFQVSPPKMWSWIKDKWGKRGIQAIFFFASKNTSHGEKSKNEDSRIFAMRSKVGNPGQWEWRQPINQVNFNPLALKKSQEVFLVFSFKIFFFIKRNVTEMQSHSVSHWCGPLFNDFALPNIWLWRITVWQER